MIYTCTLNPSIDYTMYMQQIVEGDLNRAQQTHYFPGGKGINVSRVLSRLGLETTALGFVGGFTGAFIKTFLSNEGVNHQFVEINDTTRINVKVKANKETELNGPGPIITKGHQTELFNHLVNLKEGDTLVIAGSIPSSLPTNFYEQIAKICSSKHIKLVADTSGDALANIINFNPFLIKPNHHELGELFNITINSPEIAKTYATKLINKGIKHAIVSMGAEGAVYLNQEDSVYAKVPQGKLKNSVGAGDSVVSGFLAALADNQTPIEAFRYATAAGSATAFNDDLCQKKDVERLLNEVQLLPI